MELYVEIVIVAKVLLKKALSAGNIKARKVKRNVGSNMTKSTNDPEHLSETNLHVRSTTCDLFNSY